MIESLSQTKQVIDKNVAQIWTHKTGFDEARQIANWLADDMAQRGTTSRDYALLVRQTADVFESQLAVPLSTVGLRLRNESKKIGKIILQDLFSEEFTQISLALLRLGIQNRAPAAWEKASKAIRHLRVADMYDEIACFHAEKGLMLFLTDLKKFMADSAPSVEIAKELAEKLLAFLNPTVLARTYIEYGTGNNLSIAAESFSLHLQNSAAEVSAWGACLDNFEGIDQIPLMTIHKSKGLEFDTMLFVGLDDKTWWSHSPDNPEGMATFFVALSRAKQRAIFTYSQERGTRCKVKDLYDLLAEAGVPEFQY